MARIRNELARWKRGHALYRAALLTSGSAVLTSGLLTAAPAAAQDDDEPEGEVVYVYGRSLESTLPQELADYGSDLVMLGRDELEQKRYVDPQQMLQMEVPGLHLTSAGPFSYNFVSIQGSRLARYGPSDVLWLVDGVRLNNRLYPSTNPDTLPGNMVERIEVLKGGESLYYGTSAAGGVLNIVSRDFADTFGGDVSVATDSNDSYTLSGMVRGPAGPGNYVFFASQDESDGYDIWSPAEPSATDRDQSYDVMNVGFKYGLDISDDLRFVAQLQHTEGEIDQPAPTGTYAAYNERDEEIASLRIDYAPVDGTQFFVKAYYHDWDSLYTDLTNDPGDPSAPPSGDVDVPWGYEDKGFNAAAKFRPGGAFDLLVGYDYQSYHAMDDYWRIDPISETVQAVFAQVRTSEDRVDDGAVAFGVRYNDADADAATVWNLSGKYYFGDDLYFQGGVSTNFVLPSAEQLFLNDPFCSLCGNPNLEAEESTNFNVGIGSAGGRTYWQATAFWRDIENIIDFDFSQPAFPDGRFENLGEATIEGFEVLGGVALSDRVTFDASYVNNEVELEGTDRQMDYNPRWHAKASISYDGGRYGGTFGARFVSNVTSSQGSFGRVDHGDYTVADLSLYIYADPDRRNQITFRIENAFDETYPALRGFRAASFDDGSGSFLSTLLGPPRTYHVSYRHSF